MTLVQNLDDVLNLLARRKMLVLMTALVCTIIASVVIMSQPKVFRAYAAIQVEGPQVAAGGQNNPSDNSVQIMQSIQHRLVTRENLLAMIERHDLAKLNPRDSQDDLVANLRKSIKIDTVPGAAETFGQPSISAIMIAVSTNDAELSARLANDLAQSILDMSNQGATSRARDTQLFFAGEEERLRIEIVKRESALADYQNKNTESLPVLAEARRTEVQALDTELRTLDQQLLEASAESKRLEAQATLRETDRRRMEELAESMTVINERIAFATARRDELQANLQVMPEVEQTIAAQKRELLLLQDRYASVSQNLADAETALFLAERQQSQRFMLLDRAVTPDYASGMGNRKMIMSAALGSVVIGMLAALAMELAFPVVRTAAQLERATGMTALGTIPPVPSLLRRGPSASPFARAEYYFWNVIAIAAVGAVAMMMYLRLR